MRSLLLRLRLVVADYGLSIIIVCLLIAAVGLGAIGWLGINPPTSEVTETTYENTVSTQVTTSTLVTNQTTLFATGTRLRDLPTYPRKWSDTLTIHARTDLPPTRTAQITQEVTIVYRVTIGEKTIKRESRTLASETTRVSDGSAVTNTTVNIAEIEQRRDAFAAAVGDFGSVDVIVRFGSEYRTDQYSGAFSETGTLVIDDSSVQLSGEFGNSRTHEDTTTRRRTDSHPLSEYLQWIGAVVLGLAGAGVTWREYIIKMDWGEAVDRDALIRRIQRERYSKWIVRGSLPDGPIGESFRMGSLEDLFEVAVANELRVIHDPVTDVYAVVDTTGDVTYYFGDWSDSTWS